MDSTWNDNQPIYRQLRDKVVAMIQPAEGKPRMAKFEIPAATSAK